MKKKQIYDEIVNAFSDKYSWLGEQISKEFLLSVASWNIQTFSNPDFRVRRHLLLFWNAGWIKSTLVKKMFDILGGELCSFISDVTESKLRGSVHGDTFVPPDVILKPFAISTEFGQVTGHGKEEIVQLLLNILEEGIGHVSLVKLAGFDKKKKDEAMNMNPIHFHGNAAFNFRTNWTLIACTYNRKFIVDNAFVDRFNVIIPEKKLTSELTRHMISRPKLSINEDAILSLRDEIVSEKNKIDTNIKLPDELFESNNGFSPRDAGKMMSYILCNKWWGINLTNDDIIKAYKTYKKNSISVFEESEEKVLNALSGGPMTYKDLMKVTGLSKSNLYNTLKKVRAFRTVKNGVKLWGVNL
jgi:hypothetical protein